MHLFIALGGTSYATINLARNSVGAAEIRANAVAGAEIRDESVQVRDVSRDARRALRGRRGPAGAGIAEYAVVSSNGRAVIGTAVAGSWGTMSPELHYLHFERNVSKCAYSATLAAVRGGDVVDPVPGRITVASGGGPTVIVKTYDAAGNPAALPFHLIVAC